MKKMMWLVMMMVLTMGTVAFADDDGSSTESSDSYESPDPVESVTHAVNDMTDTVIDKVGEFSNSVKDVPVMGKVAGAIHNAMKEGTKEIRKDD
jgi:hypothetical protein